MPKARSALLASASGSLKDSLTFRALPQQPDIIMQQRPVPTDRRTAKQAAVRDAYTRLAWLWKNLSHLDKEPYQIMAEARGLTPWNCWLSHHLPIMRLAPTFYLPFAEGAGTTVQDFAIGGYAGSINGPVWDEKNQFPTLSFDGVDDIVSFAPPGYYDTQPNYTIIIIETDTRLSPAYSHLIGSKATQNNSDGIALYRNASNQLVFSVGNGTTYSKPLSTFTTPPNSVNTIAITRTGIHTRFYCNGLTNLASGGFSNIPPGLSNWNVGRWPNFANPWKAKAHLIVKFPFTMTLEQLTAFDATYRPLFT